MYCLCQLVGSRHGLVLRGEMGFLAIDRLTQAEDVVEQGAAQGEDEKVGEHHLPAGAALVRIFVSTFLRHDAAKIELFPNFAANLSLP